MLPTLIRMVAVCAGLFSVAGYGNTLSWSGDGGANANWNNSANWGYAGTPQNYDTLIFPASQPNLINTNNISNLNLNQIIFAGPGGGYSIYGNAITLTNSLIATNTAGANTINNNITFSNINITILVSNSVSLTLAGSLSASVFVTNVTKIGLGTLIYSGSTGNTYTNLTTVNEGELDLAKSGVQAIAPYGAGLMIGDGSGTDTVRYLGGYQIFSVVTPITITSSGVLDLNGYSDTASPFTLNGGQITTGAGVLTVSGTVKIGGNATVSGKVALSSTLILTNTAAASILQIYAGVNGSYGITKTGAGNLFLSASNSYTGLTVVQQGWLYAQTNLALGTTNSGTVVSNGATLVLQGNIGITNESLTLNGPGVNSGWAALDVESGTNTWAGPITNNANSTLDSWNSTAALHIAGPISGAGGLELFGSGTYYFEGSTANTYAGATTVDAGTTLLLNKSVTSGVTIPQNLIINGTVRLLNSGQIASTSDVTVNSGGLLDIAAAVEEIDTLSGSGNVSLSGGVLYLGYGDGSSTFSGVISGSGNLYIEGYGTITLAGATANTYAGTTYVQGYGTLVLNKSVANGAVPGNLSIGFGCTVRLGASEQIADTANVTVGEFGALDLNNYNETIGTNLTLYDGTITTGSGVLTLSPNSTVTEHGAYVPYSSISGNMNMGSGNCTMDAEYILNVPASLSGTANLIKTGGGSLVLQSSNSYSGLTIVAAGYLDLDNSWALGSTSSGTIVSNQATLALENNIGITNESLTLYGPYGDLSCVDATTNYWVGPITLNGNPYIGVWATNGALNLNCQISGSGGFIESSRSKLTLSGSTANTYAGTTRVLEGTLLLGKSSGIKAVPGPLVMDSGTTVRLLNSFQIDSYTTPVTMSDSSLLDLAGFNEWVGPINIQGAQITSGAGILYLSGNIVVNPSTVAQSVISGNASIWNQTITITNSGYYYFPDLVISANVSSGGSGGQGLIKDGDGDVSLAGSNSFIGPVTINRGSLWAQTSAALGNTNALATINNGGNLFLDGGVLDFGLKPLVLNGIGNGFSFSALDCKGTCSWGGSITLNSDSTVCPMTGASLSLTGAVSGPGGMTEVPPGSYAAGTVIFAGSAANTYAGLTKVNAGTLLLNKSVSNGAIPTNLVVNGTVRLANSQQIADAADVLVNSGGLFDLGAYSEYIDTLRGLGTVNFGSGGWIYLGLNNGTSTFDGSFTGTGYAPGFTVGKTGSGTFTTTGNNTFSAGATHVYNGKMVINGSQPQSPVIVDSSATLGGSGTVGTIAASGIISPGTSPGMLTSSNVTFASSGQYTVELTGPTAGTGYDQMKVRGTNALASATLTVVPAFTAPVPIGQQFTIINNDLADAITGTFSGLANGAQFSAGGYTFRINYSGGDGNDVVLTLWGVPANTVILNAVDQGWYDNTGYHNPDNPNYYAGQSASATNLYRNWYVFNVPVFTNSIIHAELLINCYNNSSPHGQETYLVRKVTTSVATLEAGGSGLVGIYNDLGTGAVYSVRSIATNEARQKAIIPLNLTFMNDATAASGSQMALGGSIATLDAINNHNQYLFSSSGGASDDIQLRLTFGTNLVINSANRGWYNNSGNHTASNPNYLVGDLGGGFYRDFFVFNLPALSSQLMDAQLLVNSYTIESPDGVETYQLYDVTNSITVLTNNASGATGVYADLGSGAVYGGRNVYVSESGLILGIPLDRGFLAAALGNSGGRIALGGALASLNSSPTNEYLFRYSSGLPADVQLWLGFLAAPASRPSFVGGTPAYLGNNQFQFVVSGTTGTTNEIQGTFDYQNWDFICDLVMTNSTSSFRYTNNTVVPYRYFRAEQLP